MPRRPRRADSAHSYHVMNRSCRKLPLFITPRDYLGFTRVLSEAIARHAVDMLAFCIMPNHWHLVLHPHDDRSLSRFMHWITTTHARRWHLARETGGFGPVYKGRFLSVPLDSTDDVVRVCRYVERNPLKAGLVDEAQSWPWSSLAERHRARRRIPLLDRPFFSSQMWMHYVNLPIASSEVVAMDRLEGCAREST